MAFPTTGLLDNFNRANGGLGANWTDHAVAGFATAQILNNVYDDPSSTQFSWTIWTAATYGPDVEAYATLVNQGTDAVRVFARWNDAGGGSGYAVQVTPSTGAWTIKKFGPGATLATPPAQVVAAGDKIGIEVVGTTINAWWYDASAGTWNLIGSATDSTFTGAGNIGIEVRSQQLDDFSGGTIVTGGGSNLTLNLADTATLSDAAAKGVAATKADSAGLSDALSRTWAVARTFADTTSLTDALSKGITIPLADTATLADALAKTFGASHADTAALSDGIARTFGLDLVDSVTLSDTVAKAMAHQLADAVSLSETFTPNLALPGQALTLSLADTVTLADAFARTLTDAGATTQVASRARTIFLSRFGITQR